MGFKDRLRGALGFSKAGEKRIFDPSYWQIPPPGAGGGGSFSRPDLRTAESSLQAVAVWAATNLIANLISTTPLDAYKSGPDGTSVPLPLPKILDDPGGEGHGAADWIYQYLQSLLLRGNAYGRTASADPRTGLSTQIVLYHPDEVTGYRDEATGLPRWTVNGKSLDDPADMWHRRVYPMPGRLLGLSPIEHHAMTIGQHISAVRFGKQWYDDGAHPSSVIQNTLAEVDDDTARAVKNKYLASIYGTREPVVVGMGWEIKPLQVNPEESQFLATQRYTGAECVRIFGPGLAEMLGYEHGGTMQYSSIEQRSADTLTYNLDAWYTRTERMFGQFLPRGQYVKFNRNALLRTDLFTRYRAHALAIAARFMAPSEARSIEDMPPLTAAQNAELDALILPGPILNSIKETEK